MHVWKKKWWPAAIVRFWEKVDKRGPDDCWLWKGRVDVDGYGCHAVGSCHAKAHRFALSMEHDRQLGAREVVCHRCDNPTCVNPRHLFIGTHKDNQKDKVRKGRQARGLSCARSVLSSNAVRDIRSRYPKESTITLGAVYGVHPTTVERIVKRLTWGHLT